MALTLSATNLLTPAVVSKYIWGVDDVTAGGTILTPQQQLAVELSVDAASSQIQKATGFTFKSGTYTEVWDGVASDELIPREIPITAITSIKFSPNGDFSSATPLEAKLYYFPQGLFVAFRGDILVPRGRGMCEIIYTAGFATIPADLQIAALRQFQYLYKQIGKGDAMVGLKSIAKMNESQTKDDRVGISGLTMEVEGMIGPYKRFETSSSIMFTRHS